ncbi:MAG: PAS domain S-box protein [Syntrophales bacterium]|nr:PAS domain S-box protein [Syntrophales bacterium]
MGFNQVDPKKKDVRQVVEPHGEAVSADADFSLLNEVLFVHKYFIRAFFAVAFTILTILAVYNLLDGSLIVAVIACCMGILLLWSYFLMCKSGDKSKAPAKQYMIYQNVIRGFLLIFLIYITYTVGWKSELDRVLWSYFPPVAAFIYLGRREGFCWAAFFLASMVLILFYPRPDAVSPDAFLGFKLRYLMSFTVICAVAFAGKSGIEATYARLIHRQGQLTESEKQYREAYDGLQREMDERRQAQQALVESEEKYRLIFENSVDVIYSINRELRIIDVSPSIERAICYSPSEVVGKSIPELGLLAPESLESAFSDIMRILGGASIPAAPYTFIAKNGLRHYAEVSGAPLMRNGEVVGVISVARDITVRKLAEEALQESWKRIQLIVDNARDVIWMTDMNLRLTFISSSVEQMLGYTVEEFITKPYHEILVPASLDLLLKIYAEELALGNDLKKNIYRSRTAETEQIHKNGSRMWIEMKINLIEDADGTPAGIIGFSRDITDRKRKEEEKQILEERLQRAERMESLGILAGGVAHDLNNVLGVLFVYTELLLEKIPEKSPLRNYVDNILSSGEKGAAIIQDLLTLARRGVIVHEVVNVNSVVSGFFKTPVFEKLETYHPRVAFRKELSEELLNVKGSAVHLEKTVMNLLSNAAEAISGNGEITIRTENRYLDRPIHGYDKVKEGEYAVLTVSDTGRGISTADIGKIFEPFYTKKVMGKSGTGLGLAIVWGTVKDHDGYIDVQSKKGKGTVFTLYFPVTREELAEEKEKIPVEQYMGRGESILVVDDTVEQRDIANRLLTRLGYQVHAVSSGEEAVEYLKTHKADLLLLDMIMDPGIDGLETYKRVQEINPKQRAIIVSGFSETERVKKTQNLGAGAYIRKPYLMEKIGVAVRDELRKVECSSRYCGEGMRFAPQVPCR